jgi:DNA-binding CsgD family transcriptional regulator
MRRQSLVEDEHVLDSLGKIVSSVPHEASWRDDLMQEALLHLWRSEQERPGQTASWYLQGCRFRLQHYLGAGRSLDSTKRRFNRVVVAREGQTTTEVLDHLETSGIEFDEVSARDLQRTISASLRPPECAVLDCLADGLPTADIARRLRLSSPTVTKYRRKIAHLAAKLGMRSSRGLEGSSRH